MKKIFLLTFILKTSFLLSMQPDPAEHIKRQIRQFKAEGASTQEIAQLSTDALRTMLEYPLLNTPVTPYIDLYKTLIEAGADKNVQHPKNGKTALMFAALDGRADIVKELLNLGIDYQLRDNHGLNIKDLLSSPLLLMSKSDKAEIQELLETIDRSKIS